MRAHALTALCTPALLPAPQTVIDTGSFTVMDQTRVATLAIDTDGEYLFDIHGGNAQQAANYAALLVGCELRRAAVLCSGAPPRSPCCWQPLRCGCAQPRLARRSTDVSSCRRPGTHPHAQMPISSSLGNWVWTCK